MQNILLALLAAGALNVVGAPLENSLSVRCDPAAEACGAVSRRFDYENFYSHPDTPVESRHVDRLVKREGETIDGQAAADSEADVDTSADGGAG